MSYTFRRAISGLFQRCDGTVIRQNQSGEWEYLSPLFGEWLVAFDPVGEDLEPYPRNLGKLTADQIDTALEMPRLAQ